MLDKKNIKEFLNSGSNWRNVLIFILVFIIFLNDCSATNQIREGETNNFSIEANIQSSKILIKNIGNTTLTNIRILKDERDIIEQIPQLKVGENRSIYIPEISGIILEEKEPTAQNEGWLAITCDQGDEKKLVYWECHPVTSYPSPQDILLHEILPLILLITGVVMVVISWVKKRKK